MQLQNGASVLSSHLLWAPATPPSHLVLSTQFVANTFFTALLSSIWLTDFHITFFVCTLSFYTLFILGFSICIHVLLCSSNVAPHTFNFFPSELLFCVYGALPSFTWIVLLCCFCEFCTNFYVLFLFIAFYVVYIYYYLCIIHNLMYLFFISNIVIHI